MRIWVNDTFCLYLGWFLVFFGFMLIAPSEIDPILFRLGLGLIGLGISTQLMAFQRKPKDKD